MLWQFFITLFWALLIVSRCKKQPASPQFVAVKIEVCRYGSIAAAEHELKLSPRIAAANPSHPGASYIRVPIEITGSDGSHTCLVHHPMRETLYDFRSRFKKQRFPPHILKLYIAILLQGLNYLHSEYHLIHTGKPLLHLRTGIPLLTLIS